MVVVNSWTPQGFFPVRAVKKIEAYFDKEYVKHFCFLDTRMKFLFRNILIFMSIFGIYPF